MKLQLDKTVGMFCVTPDSGESYAQTVEACLEAGAVDEQGRLYVKLPGVATRELLTPRELRQRLEERAAAKAHAPHCARNWQPELNIGRPDDYRCTCATKHWRTPAPRT